MKTSDEILKAFDGIRVWQRGDRRAPHKPLLILPKRHVATFFDTTTEERLSMFKLMDKAKLALDAAFHPAAYNIGVNDGPLAGQTIPHVHIHLIPRYAGDDSDPRGGVRRIFPKKAKYWE